MVIRTMLHRPWWLCADNGTTRYVMRVVGWRHSKAVLREAVAAIKAHGAVPGDFTPLLGRNSA